MVREELVALLQQVAAHGAMLRQCPGESSRTAETIPVRRVGL